MRELSHISEILEALFLLKRDKRADHERPHKPVLLLTLLDLVESGRVIDNRFAIDATMHEWWGDYFEVVRANNDQPTPQNPIFHLCGDGFWELNSKPGFPALYLPGKVGAAPSLKRLRDEVDFASLDSEMFAAFADPDARREIRESLITRYFPDKWAELMRVSADHCHRLYEDAAAETGTGAEPIARAAESPARSSAFKATVIKVYEHQCAACGLRIRTPSGITLVDAAHIIPFCESQDDRPGNGIALCKNHHWAMDRNLIAPGVDLLWHAHEGLDARQDGQLTLINLAGKPLLLPKEPAFHPLAVALEWRGEEIAARLWQ
ncbi:MAG: HNH endonuclease [Verrucomicrobiales bacterium]